MATLPAAATTTPLHLTVDPWWDLLTALAYGRTDDGLPDEQVVALDEEPRVRFVLDAPGRGPVIGFSVSEPHDVDVLGSCAPGVWDGPRFDVPALALTQATLGEIVRAVQTRYDRGEPTADALHFHRAIATGEDAAADLDEAVERWRLALEAGETKALFGLGYTLVQAERPREAYDALRRYTELTPHNAWAWCWLGRACAGTGDLAEARAAFERALACERAGSFATDAEELLGGLGS
jgi:tetratricopeptide (TPR) repeat protein